MPSPVPAGFSGKIRGDGNAALSFAEFLYSTGVYSPMPHFSRCRRFSGFLAGSFAWIILLPTGDASASSLLAVDQRKIVSRADLSFNEPAKRSEEGLPVGTGRMGSLVWTSPSALKLQINR